MIQSQFFRAELIRILLIGLPWLLPIYGVVQTAPLKTPESEVRIDWPGNLQSAKKIETEETVIRFCPRSAWSANTRTGRSIGGTWTGVIDLSAGTASGSWTVVDSAGQVVLRGTWSAAKEAQRWRGSWRALIAGNTKEQTGSWSAGLSLPPESPLASMFKQALQQAISGTWQSYGQSGAWSIRAVR